MIRAQVEYLGFQESEHGRDYRLRGRLGKDDFREYSLLIAQEAFTSRRVRFQDAAEICYLKLQHDLSSASDLPVPLQQAVTDAELEAYRVAHAAKVSRGWLAKDSAPTTDSAASRPGRPVDSTPAPERP